MHISVSDTQKNNLKTRARTECVLLTYPNFLRYRKQKEKESTFRLLQTRGEIYVS